MPRSVLDPLHGLVRLTNEELAVLNDAVFQRLRQVKQNGLLHLVFPAATHSRFEHSIGALFVADSILRNLIWNSTVAREKHKQQGVLPRETVQPRQALDFASLPGDDLARIFRVTRLAALVHDLGHGPLSHTFDSFAPSRSAIASVLADPQLESLAALRETMLQYDLKKGQDQGSRIPHEVMSCIFFALIWRRLKGDEDQDIPAVVAAAILGTVPPALIDPKYRPWVPLIHDLTASAPADADRMDYLERDSKSCGVAYGVFDRNRLLKTFLCYRGVEEESETYRLGLKLSGYRAVENFIQARFELFVQIYYHKTNRAIEMMLHEISEIAKEKEFSVVETACLQSLVDAYVELSDERFLNDLRGTSGTRAAIQDETINRIANDIHDRKLWHRIIDFQEHQISPERKGLLRDNLAARFPDAKLGFDQLKARATKDLEKGAVPLIRNQCDIYEANPDLTWMSVSRIIEALHEDEESLTRLYLQADNSTLAKKLRAELLKLFASSQEGNR